MSFDNEREGDLAEDRDAQADLVADVADEVAAPEGAVDSAGEVSQGGPDLADPAERARREAVAEDIREREDDPAFQAAEEQERENARLAQAAHSGPGDPDPAVVAQQQYSGYPGDQQGHGSDPDPERGVVPAGDARLGAPLTETPESPVAPPVAPVGGGAPPASGTAEAPTDVAPPAVPESPESPESPSEPAEEPTPEPEPDPAPVADPTDEPASGTPGA